MSDTLVVSGGGIITVASEDLLVAADRARALADELDAVGDRLLGVAPPGELRGLAMQAGALAYRLRRVSLELELALDAYSFAEAAIASAAGSAASEVAHWAGLFAPAALALAPAVLAPAALALVGTPVVLVPGALWFAAGAPGAAPVLEQHRALLSHPRFVALLRTAAGSVDDAARGALRMPRALSQAADDRATGVVGRAWLARMLLTALPGPTPSGPVRLIPGESRRVRPPESLAELAERIPEPQIEGPQLRVERYEGPSGPVYALYLGGTVELDLESGAEPWDLASNLGAMGDVPAHSLGAAESALRASGATAADPVVLVGYSQGGLLASRLAESGEFSVRGMVTVGSPGGDIPPPEGVPVLAVEHAEDLVPALAGPVAAAGARVVVTRSLYDGRPPESSRAVPAHELAAYRSTLALADRSQERRVSGVREEVLGLFPRTGGRRNGDAVARGTAGMRISGARRRAAAARDRAPS